MRFCNKPSIALRGLTAIIIVAVVTSSTVMAGETSERVYKIGFLGQTSAKDLSHQISALRRGLWDFGYEEGRNLTIEYRWLSGNLTACQFSRLS
jgi:hypothetical protein